MREGEEGRASQIRLSSGMISLTLKRQRRERKVFLKSFGQIGCLTSTLDFSFPHLLLGPNGLRGLFWGQIVLNKKCATFCLKHLLKPFFPKTRFRSNFFYEIDPSPTFRAKRSLWCILGQNCSRQNFATFCLKRPRNRFPKNTFPVQIFLRNCSLNYFRGKTDYVAHFGPKLF